MAQELLCSVVLEQGMTVMPFLVNWAFTLGELLCMLHVDAMQCETAHL